jgi:hypothetical protein
MNIFILDTNPSCATVQLCDKHVVKMVLETAQILCSALSIHGITAPYKATHTNHPCVKWASESWGNAMWLWRYGVYLGWEYTYRYGRVHKSADVINWARPHIDAISGDYMTPFVQCMPEQYHNTDGVTAYRNYYVAEKLHFAKWTKRDVPIWIQEKQ